MSGPDEELAEALVLLTREHIEVEDWQVIRDLALKHGVLGLIYPNVESDEGKRALFPDYARQASLSLAHLAILSYLRDAGLEFLPMKGSSLIARGLYAPQERPMLDIDLLVKPGDIQGFRSILLSKGFSDVIASRKGFVMHRGKLSVDLHIYPLKPELYIPPKPLWARSVNGFLSPEDELIIISAHAALGSFTFGPRLIWQEDAKRILRLADPEKSLGLARALGLEGCVLRLLRAKSTDIVMAQRQPGRLRKLALAWGSGANKGQKAMCIAMAFGDRIENLIRSIKARV
ncbi:MAG: nucleotidyltransferase family protein [candidate division WOR-3 bacterium]